MFSTGTEQDREQKINPFFALIIPRHEPKPDTPPPSFGNDYYYYCY